MAVVRKLAGHALVEIRDPAYLRKVGGFALVGSPFRLVMTGTTEQMVRELINRGSTTVWSEETLDLVSTDEQIGVSGVNSKITILAKPGSGYIGTIGLLYRRVNFSRLFIDLDLSEPLSPIVDLADALSQINQCYGLFLEESDVEATVVSGQTQVTLTASNTNYVVLPGTEVTIGT